MYGVSLPEDDISSKLYTQSSIENLIRKSFRGDIRNYDFVQQVAQETEPEVLFHFAAQSLVGLGYEDPVATFSTNIMGTISVLEAVRKAKGVQSIVVSTTDKVYRNVEMGIPFQESDPLGGFDPYSSSKASAEIVIESYWKSFLKARNIGVGVVRAGNIIGGGDWSANRLIPDAIAAWTQEEKLLVRNPTSIRPWQHVLDALRGYLILAERTNEKKDFNIINVGPSPQNPKSSLQLVKEAMLHWPESQIHETSRVSNGLEARTLLLDTSLASRSFGISQVWDFEESVRRTIDWYRLQSCGSSSYALCLADIEKYEGDSASLEKGSTL